MSAAQSGQVPSTKPAAIPNGLRRVLALFSGKKPDREALVEVLRDAESRHVINGDTFAMMEGALLVSEMNVAEIMVPRSQMVVTDEDANPQEILADVIESGHSRFPVYDDKRERILGILLAKDLLPLALDEAREFDIQDIIRPAVFVPESKRLNILLREFRMSRNHLAIVVDEYGGVSGLVSIEDVIEQIVGEIDDEYDLDEEEYIRQHRGQRYTVKAITPIDDFNEFFETELEANGYDTVGGLVIDQFGHVPKRGEEIAFEGFEFKVLRADPRRIRVLRVITTTGEAE